MDEKLKLAKNEKERAPPDPEAAELSEFVHIVTPTVPNVEASQGSLWYLPMNVLKSLALYCYISCSAIPASSVRVEERPLSTEEERALYENWEWITSKAEEIAERRAKEEGAKIQEELSMIRNTKRQLQFLVYFSNVVKPAFGKLSGMEEKEAIRTPLDSSKVSKIVSDVIKSSENKWLQIVKETCFGAEVESQWDQFQENYFEKPYQKNTIGAMKELTCSAASSSSKTGLTEKTLADILWSLWKCLTESIRNTLETDLDSAQLDVLAGTVAVITEPFTKLWVETVIKSKTGREREGLVVSRWKQEDALRAQKLKAIKLKGADARYEITSYVTPTLCVSEMTNKKDVKKYLEQNLPFLKQSTIV